MPPTPTIRPSPFGSRKALPVSEIPPDLYRGLDGKDEFAKVMPRGRLTNGELANVDSSGNVFGGEQQTDKKKPPQESLESYSFDSPLYHRKDLETTHEFSSTQFNIADAGYSRSDGSPLSKIQELINKIRTEDLAQEGKEDTPHITVKFGLHTDDPEEVRQVVQKWIESRGGQPTSLSATLGKVSLFSPKETGKDYEVLKIDVESTDLDSLNQFLAHNLENTDEHPDYKPHITLAYVKPGRGHFYVGSDLGDQEIILNKLLFSDKNRDKTPIDLWHLDRIQTKTHHLSPHTPVPPNLVPPLVDRERIYNRARRLKVRIINATEFRKKDSSHQEFGTWATHDDYSEIPANEVWITSDCSKEDRRYFVLSAAAYLEAIDNGASKEEAGDFSLYFEEAERTQKKVGGEGNRPLHHEVEQDIYIKPWKELHQDGEVIQVWIVDGQRCRESKKTNFFSGGHAYVYPWIPEDEIWIEQSQNEAELEYCLLHENTERKLMKHEKLGYDQAHEHAAALELKARQKEVKSCPNCGGATKRIDMTQGWRCANPPCEWSMLQAGGDSDQERNPGQQVPIRSQEQWERDHSDRKEEEVQTYTQTHVKAHRPGLGMDYDFYRRAYDRWRVKPDIIGDRRLRLAFERQQPADEMAMQNDELFRLKEGGGPVAGVPIKGLVAVPNIDEMHIEQNDRHIGGKLSRQGKASKHLKSLRVKYKAGKEQESAWTRKCPDGRKFPLGSGTCGGRYADSWDGVVDKNNEPGWADYPDYAPVVGVDTRDPDKREKPVVGIILPHKKNMKPAVKPSPFSKALFGKGPRFGYKDETEAPKPAPQPAQINQPEAPSTQKPASTPAPAPAAPPAAPPAIRPTPFGLATPQERGRHYEAQPEIKRPEAPERGKYSGYNTQEEYNAALQRLQQEMAQEPKVQWTGQEVAPRIPLSEQEQQEELPTMRQARPSGRPLKEGERDWGEYPAAEQESHERAPTKTEAAKKIISREVQRQKLGAIRGLMESGVISPNATYEEGSRALDEQGWKPMIGRGTPEQKAERILNREKRKREEAEATKETPEQRASRQLKKKKPGEMTEEEERSQNKDNREIDRILKEYKGTPEARMITSSNKIGRERLQQFIDEGKFSTPESKAAAEKLLTEGVTYGKGDNVRHEDFDLGLWAMKRAWKEERREKRPISPGDKLEIATSGVSDAYAELFLPLEEQGLTWEENFERLKKEAAASKRYATQHKYDGVDPNNIAHLIRIEISSGVKKYWKKMRARIGFTPFSQLPEGKVEEIASPEAQERQKKQTISQLQKTANYLANIGPQRLEQPGVEPSVPQVASFLMQQLPKLYEVGPGKEAWKPEKMGEESIVRQLADEALREEGLSDEMRNQIAGIDTRRHYRERVANYFALMGALINGDAATTPEQRQKWYDEARKRAANRDVGGFRDVVNNYINRKEQKKAGKSFLWARFKKITCPDGSPMPLSTRTCSGREGWVPWTEEQRQQLTLSEPPKGPTPEHGPIVGKYPNNQPVAPPPVGPSLFGPKRRSGGR